MTLRKRQTQTRTRKRRAQRVPHTRLVYYCCSPRATQTRVWAVATSRDTEGLKKNKDG